MLSSERSVCIVIVFSFFIAIPGTQSSFGYEEVHAVERIPTVTIRVALYDCSNDFNKQQFYAAFNYCWRCSNRFYRFDLTVIDRDNVLGGGSKPLTNENFDVIVIGASAKS